MTTELSEPIAKDAYDCYNDMTLEFARMDNLFNVLESILVNTLGAWEQESAGSDALEVVWCLKEKHERARQEARLIFDKAIKKTA